MVLRRGCRLLVGRYMLGKYGGQDLLGCMGVGTAMNQLRLNVHHLRHDRSGFVRGHLHLLARSEAILADQRASNRVYASTPAC